MLRIAIKILWPAFLVAILAEGCFFTLFDPDDLSYIAGRPELPPIAGYTIGFFFFLALCALAGLLTYYLIHVPNDDQTL